VRLAEAPSYGLPALAYDKSSRGAIAYLALAGEMNRRTNSKKSTSEKSVDSHASPTKNTTKKVAS
jgi:chromosome partitioning protein